MKSTAGYSNGVSQKASKAVTKEDRDRDDHTIQFRKIGNGWIKHETWMDKKKGHQTMETYMEKNPLDDNDEDDK